MNFETKEHIALIDITSEVKREVKDSGVIKGLCIVTTRHTSAGIIINEYELGICSDILDLLNKLVPPDEAYQHNRIDTNADSHLKAMLLGSSEVIPIVDGRLQLGAWQSILFAEMDGPRTNRSVDVTVIKSE